MRSRTKKVLACSSLAAIALAFFFLPVVPVTMMLWCIPCAGLPFFEHGYSSAGLYLFGYGGAYVLALPPNEFSLYVGYCFVDGPLGDHTSCGVGVAIVPPSS